MTQAAPTLPDRETLIADADAGTYAPTAEMQRAYRTMLDELGWDDTSRIVGLTLRTLSRIVHGRPVRWSTLLAAHSGLLHHYGPRKLAAMMEIDSK